MGKGNALIGVNPDITIVRPAMADCVRHRACMCSHGIGVTLQSGGYEASYSTHA
jgi:hypothetical protein